MLSDENSDVCEKYGVWNEKINFGKKYFGIIRSTFLIDEKGEIIKEWRKVKVEGHVDEIIEELDLVLKLLDLIRSESFKHGIDFQSMLEITETID